MFTFTAFRFLDKFHYYKTLIEKAKMWNSCLKLSISIGFESVQKATVQKKMIQSRPHCSTGIVFSDEHADRHTNENQNITLP